MPAPVDSHSGRRGARPRSAFKDQSSQASTRRRPPCANGSPGNGPRSLGGSLAARRARTPTAGSPGSWTPAAGGTAHPPVTQAPKIGFSRTRSSPPVQITPPSSGPPGWRGAQLLVVLPRRHLRAVHEATPQVGRHGPPAVSARAGVRSGRSRVVRPQGVRTQLLRQPRDWREGPWRWPSGSFRSCSKVPSHGARPAKAGTAGEGLGAPRPLAHQCAPVS